MYTKTLIAATLAGLAVAAPVARDAVDTVGLIALRSTTAIHLSTVSENGLKFWIHKDTATYCPPQAEPCPSKSNPSPPSNTKLKTAPAGNSTQLLASTTSEGISLNANVPGGQQVYVASDGSLSATQAHSANTGDNGLRGPFEYTPAPTSSVGSLLFNNLSFTACPVATDPNVYQVFALGYPGFVAGTGCIAFNLGTYPGTSSPVWQYI